MVFKKGEAANPQGNNGTGAISRRDHLLLVLERRLRDRGLLVDNEKYDPVVELAAMGMCTDGSVSKSLRMQCHAEVASYIYPKLKSITLEVGKDEGEEEKSANLLEGIFKMMAEATANKRGESGKPALPAPTPLMSEPVEAPKEPGKTIDAVFAEVDVKHVLK